ncbi:MAG TPA: hypothetical protein VK254_03900 [Candidatus Bathyarchaeia archaeon]|nr:hypothetical protein [Candidatus Bathyarchaeia archaeon]
MEDKCPNCGEAPESCTCGSEAKDFHCDCSHCGHPCGPDDEK